MAFESDATNLVAGDGNGARDIFVKDLQTGAIWCASTDAQGVFGNGVSSSPDITADGRYVVFQSDAPNLVPGDSNGATDVFIKDIQTGAIRRVSTDALGAGGNAGLDIRRASALTDTLSRSKVRRPIWCRVTPIPTPIYLSRIC